MNSYYGTQQDGLAICSAYYCIYVLCVVLLKINNFDI